MDIDPRAFTRIIRWSVEDEMYVGSLPEIAPDCCHGASVAEVAALLDDIAEDSLYVCQENGIPFDLPGSALLEPAPRRPRGRPRKNPAE